MITERDLEQAIAECQGERHPNANTCIKLAAYYTIKHELFGAPNDYTDRSFSYAPGQSIEYSSDTEFAQTITGKDPETVWPIIDELMTAVQVMLPRLYNGVMRRLQE